MPSIPSKPIKSNKKGLINSTVLPVQAKTIKTTIVWNIDFNPHLACNFFKFDVSSTSASFKGSKGN